MAATPESEQKSAAQVATAPAGEAAASEKKPAARKTRGRVFINEERCKGCGLCITFCPSKVLERSDRFNTKGFHPPQAARPEDCTGCDMCGYFCPDYAIYGVRTDKTGGKEDN